MVGIGGSPRRLIRRMAVRMRCEREDEEQPPSQRSYAGTSLVEESEAAGTKSLPISETMDEFNWSQRWNRTGDEVLGVSCDDEVRKTVFGGRALHSVFKIRKI